MRIAVLGVAIVFIGLSILVVGLIQDLLANEFTQFDLVTSHLISILLPHSWTLAFKNFNYLTFYPILMCVTGVLIVWVVIKGKNRFLEFRFIIVTLLGGEILEELLRFIFHRLGPLGTTIVGHARYTFPSEQSLMAIVTYGFAAFIIMRHLNRKWVGTVTTIIILVICVLSVLSPLFFQFQYPSDVVAGYVFGGVWLSLNIVLLEVFRILPDIKG